MKIAIFGMGGVGGYFGGRLAQTDHAVYFIARGKHLAAMQANGLQVNSEKGAFVAQPALATDDPAQVGAVDYIILATKAWQVEDAARQMQPMIGEHTTLVPFLNGVEAPTQLAKIYGDDKVVGGFCRVMSFIEAPGVISQGGVEPIVAFGEMDNQASVRVQKLREIFESAQVTVENTPDIQAAMWQKLLFIASFSGVGAVTRAPVGIMRSIPQTHQMLVDAMQEVFDVARARKIALADDAVEKATRFVDSLPQDGTASMQRDILDGRPSELEAQNGAVVRLGAEVGIAVPTHAYIYNTLLPAEKKARGEVEW